jgi:hypothetical protein
MFTQAEQEDELARLQSELERLSTEQQVAYKKYQKEIDVVSTQIRALVRSSDFDSRKNLLQARRNRVLAQLFDEHDTKHIARALGVARNTIENDVWRLRLQGLYPVRLASSSDGDARRRNHVLRVWSYSTVKTVSDALTFLPDLDQKTISSDLRCLPQHGSVDWPPETPHEETPVPAPPSRAPAPPPPAPRPVPGQDPPKTNPGTRVATTEELLEEVSKRCSELEKDEVTIRTSTTCKHSHNALLDRKGDGLTTPDDSGHQHRVSRFCVLPSEKHTHELVLP